MDYVMSTVARMRQLAADAGDEPKKLAPELQKTKKAGKEAHAAALAGLDDDLNTAVAIAQLGELVRAGNDLCDLAVKRRKDAAFVAGAAFVTVRLLVHVDDLCDRLGLLQCSPQQYAERTRAQRVKLRGLSETDLDAKVAARDEARKQKDFARSDALRDELSSLGVTLRDAQTGTEWTIDVS